MKKGKRILASFLVAVLCMVPLKSYAFELKDETVQMEVEDTDNTDALTSE